MGGEGREGGVGCGARRWAGARDQLAKDGPAARHSLSPKLTKISDASDLFTGRCITPTDSFITAHEMPFSAVKVL